MLPLPGQDAGSDVGNRGRKQMPEGKDEYQELLFTGSRDVDSERQAYLAIRQVCVA